MKRIAIVVIIIMLVSWIELAIGVEVKDLGDWAVPVLWIALVIYILDDD